MKNSLGLTCDRVFSGVNSLCGLPTAPSYVEVYCGVVSVEMQGVSWSFRGWHMCLGSGDERLVAVASPGRRRGKFLLEENPIPRGVCGMIGKERQRCCAEKWLEEKWPL